jgi:Domain of unknown function (DUF4347)
MTASRLTGLFLCSTAIGAMKPSYAPDGAVGYGGGNNRKPRCSSVFTVLEPRMLFDAAGAETLDSAIDNFDIPHDATRDNAEHDALLAALDAPVTVASNNVVFIDSAVNDFDVLLAGIGPDANVYILDAHSDGVEQMAAVLQDRGGLDSISIISHGRSGTLDLGSSKLTEASMAGRHADEMAIIRASLSENADVLIYGCDFASGARGEAALQAFAIATGADVAASEDLTGAADLGGNWILEGVVGDVTTVAFAVDHYQHTLWSTSAVAAGWYGDAPTNTPNATINAGTGIISAGPMTGGAGIILTNVTLSGATSAFQIAGVAATTYAQAITNNDYITSDILVGSEAVRISSLTFNQRSENPTAGRMGVGIINVATNVITELAQGILIDGTTKNVVVTPITFPQ